MKSLILVAVVLGLSMDYVFSQAEQTAAADTSSAPADTSGTKAPERYEEFILETIRIEAVIEKPSVTLIPKKIETDVGQIPFGNRSFDKELKDLPVLLKDFGRELEEGQRIKKFKKKLAKETE
jgi:hypothetical protein